LGPVAKLLIIGRWNSQFTATTFKACAQLV
jgi:hypothetical protein